MVGRPCNQIARGLMRKETGKHVIVYKNLDETVLVCRVLHQSTLPGGRDFDDNR